MGFEKKRKNAIPSATYTTHQAGQSNPIQTILGIKKIHPLCQIGLKRQFKNYGKFSIRK
mgnify:CR=1 FL=1